jgi:hypothetical protein
MHRLVVILMISIGGVRLKLSTKGQEPTYLFIT